MMSCLNHKCVDELQGIYKRTRLMSDIEVIEIEDISESPWGESAPIRAHRNVIEISSEIGLDNSMNRLDKSRVYSSSPGAIARSKTCDKPFFENKKTGQEKSIEISASYQQDTSFSNWNSSTIKGRHATLEENEPIDPISLEPVNSNKSDIQDSKSQCCLKENWLNEIVSDVPSSPEASGNSFKSRTPNNFKTASVAALAAKWSSIVVEPVGGRPTTSRDSANNSSPFNDTPNHRSMGSPFSISPMVSPPRKKSRTIANKRPILFPESSLNALQPQILAQSEDILDTSSEKPNLFSCDEKLSFPATETLCDKGKKKASQLEFRKVSKKPSTRGCNIKVSRAFKENENIQCKSRVPRLNLLNLLEDSEKESDLMLGNVSKSVSDTEDNRLHGHLDFPSGRDNERLLNFKKLPGAINDDSLKYSIDPTRLHMRNFVTHGKHYSEQESETTIKRLLQNPVTRKMYNEVNKVTRDPDSLRSEITLDISHNVYSGFKEQGIELEKELGPTLIKQNYESLPIINFKRKTTSVYDYTHDIFYPCEETIVEEPVCVLFYQALDFFHLCRTTKSVLFHEIRMLTKNGRKVILVLNGYDSLEKSLNNLENKEYRIRVQEEMGDTANTKKSKKKTNLEQKLEGLKLPAKDLDCKIDEMIVQTGVHVFPISTHSEFITWARNLILVVSRVRYDPLMKNIEWSHINVKSGQDGKDVLSKTLEQLNLMTRAKAQRVVNVYPSFQKIFDDVSKGYLTSGNDGKPLMSETIEKAMTTLLTSDDPTELIYMD